MSANDYASAATARLIFIPRMLVTLPNPVKEATGPSADGSAGGRLWAPSFPDGTGITAFDQNS